MFNWAAAALGGNAVISAGNYFLQRENLDWQKKAQRTTWEREDNAVQRRAADLEAAGLSKTLAAGSAAQSSGPIRTDAPQIQGLDMAQMAINLMRMKADVSKTYAETEMIKQQGALAAASAASQIQEKEYKAEINPLTIQQAKNQIEIQGLNKSLMKLDQAVKALDIKKSDIEVVKKQIEAEISGKYSMKMAELEAIAKRMAVDIEQTRRDEAQWNLSKYKQLGYPTGTNLGMFEKGGILAGQKIGDLLNKIRDNVQAPENRGNVPPWAEEVLRNRR